MDGQWELAWEWGYPYVTYVWIIQTRYNQKLHREWEGLGGLLGVESTREIYGCVTTTSILIKAHQKCENSFLICSKWGTYHYFGGTPFTSACVLVYSYMCKWSVASMCYANLRSTYAPQGANLAISPKTFETGIVRSVHVVPIWIILANYTHCRKIDDFQSETVSILTW